MKNKKSFRTIDFVYTALGAVLITLCSWLCIPSVIPFTMQTFAVFAVLSLLGGRRGTLAILLYLLLGAVGVPVFSNFGSGIGALFGTTGGYLLGFVFTGLIYWGIVGRLGRKLWTEILALTLGLLVLYAFGTAWYVIVYSGEKGSVSVFTALSLCVFPFVVPDIVKLALALLVSGKFPRDIISK